MLLDLGFRSQDLYDESSISTSESRLGAHV
jgi:hypothetical protein